MASEKVPVPGAGKAVGITATPYAKPAAAPTTSVPREMSAPDREVTDKAEERRERRLRRNMAKSLPVLELGPLRNGGNFEVRKKN